MTTQIELAQQVLHTYGWSLDGDDLFGNGYTHESYAGQVIRVEDASTLRWEHEGTGKLGIGCESLRCYLRDYNQICGSGDPDTGLPYRPAW